MKKDIFYRYVFLLIIFLFLDSYFFYNLLNFLFYLFLKLFFNLNFDFLLQIEMSNVIFEITKECLAISVYMLLSLFILTIPITFKKSIKLLFFSFLFFTIFNLIRILFLIFIFYFFGDNLFEKLHFIFYSGMSGLFLGLILLYLYKKENIKEIIPFYYDLKYLFSKLK
jgi:exosortase/archaeosortase family protein